MDKLNLDDVNERDIEGFEKVYNTKEWEDTLTEGIQKFAVPALKKVQEETAKAKDAEFAKKIEKLREKMYQLDYTKRQVTDKIIIQADFKTRFNKLINEIFPDTDKRGNKTR